MKSLLVSNTPPYLYLHVCCFIQFVVIINLGNLKTLFCPTYSKRHFFFFPGTQQKSAFYRFWSKHQSWENLWWPQEVHPPHPVRLVGSADCLVPQQQIHWSERHLLHRGASVIHPPRRLVWAAGVWERQGGVQSLGQWQDLELHVRRQGEKRS